MEEILLVLTNTGTAEEARLIAKEATENHLAAAAQVIGPVTSFFQWQGVHETVPEWICLMKTTRRRYDEVEQLIKMHHSYELPSILALSVVAGSVPYIEWISRVTALASHSQGEDDEGQ